MRPLEGGLSAVGIEGREGGGGPTMYVEMEISMERVSFM